MSIRKSILNVALPAALPVMLPVAMLVALLFALSSCSNCGNNLPVEKTQFDKMTLSGFLSIESDSMQINLFDYFPEVVKADSVAFVGESILPSAELLADNHVEIITPDSAGKLFILNVWENGKKGSIITINKTRQFDSERAPVLATSGSCEEKFSIRCVRNEVENIVVLWQNTALGNKFYTLSDTGIEVKIPRNAMQRNRSFIRIIASNKHGVSNDIFVPLEYGKIISCPSQLTRSDRQAMIMYFLMIDRFEDGYIGNNHPLKDSTVLPKANYYGGDLQGVVNKIASGFFDSLGINTIWLSPISQNPLDAWGLFPDPQTKFSGYHGYWPVYNTQIDFRFGSDKIFKNLISDAHSRNYNVLIDYVANHLHINSPTFKQHPDWKTPDTTPDGRPNFELWDEFRLTTWFDRHIPTLDLERPEITDAMTDTALYWMENYNIDGYRHDATKHIPELYWRTLIKKMKARYPNRNIYQIGETYGDPSLINSYVKTGMLDAQFDFNIYDAIIWTLADTWSGGASMKRISYTLDESFRTYGYHNLMGIISGNQDRARFISLAGGSVMHNEDYKVAGWTRDITIGDSIFSYGRLKMLQAFMFTLPGIPCIYYGDEYGMPGANDPDNRRMMQFGNYTPMQQSALDNTRSLIKMRKNSMPLIYGDFIPLFVDDDVLVYERVYMGEWVIAAFNMSMTERNVNVKEMLSGKEIAVTVAANDYKIISNDKCCGK